MSGVTQRDWLVLQAKSLPIITRNEARAANAILYFTGLPCSHGHVAPRYTSTTKCAQCSRDGAKLRQRTRYEASPEEFRKLRLRKKLNSPETYMFRGVRSRAKSRGVNFDLTLADISIPENCPCCGRKIQCRTGGGKHGPIPSSPSLDRINADQGYVVGNIAVICWRCNELKRNASTEELRTILNWMESKSPIIRTAN